MKQTVIAIVGPTAVGKTKLGVEVAKRFNGEVISGDSMQVYKGMDIGTAKATKSEMQGIPHHMIDIKNPDEPFSVADFQYHVRRCITEISTRGKLPILVGGSGLYIQSILYDYQFTEQKRNDALTLHYERIIAEQGIDPLYSKLEKVDPVQAAKIHPNNHRRVMRALEIFETTGQTMTDYLKQQESPSLYHHQLIGLEMERELLYQRINERVDQMVAKGLVSEVEQLYQYGYQNSQSMNAIGYKEIIPYIEGDQSLEQCVAILKRNSRRYAKRQFTWFKNKMDVEWYRLEPSTVNERFRLILDDLAGVLNDI
ncbi:tRNA (adenosine(37)-N6)-dimethylallyltransferase MiaA [Virgibacillus xinjiangensis]|uniref:tRNA dimethylallyltransferase n=1 Tax=Virgibacillus xinjiangensis TaxID=393090 RepID=A0ABV7CUG6_9BACI